jgi:hypothetical protein
MNPYLFDPMQRHSPSPHSGLRGTSAGQSLTLAAIAAARGAWRALGRGLRRLPERTGGGAPLPDRGGAAALPVAPERPRVAACCG